MDYGIFSDLRVRYAPWQAWIYDYFIAPAVATWFDRMYSELLPRVPRTGKLLDVGCGGGHLLAFLAERHPGVSLAGLDQSAGQVARARRRLRSISPSAEVIEGDAQSMPFAEGQFDVVVSVASIKHWPDPGRGLAECARVLRPGGTLVVVELDRSAHLEDTRSFVSRTRFPAPLRTPMLAVVHTFFQGRSLDVQELRALAEPLPLSELRVKRVEGTPGMMLFGRKAA